VRVTTATPDKNQDLHPEGIDLKIDKAEQVWHWGEIDARDAGSARRRTRKTTGFLTGKEDRRPAIRMGLRTNAPLRRYQYSGST
jgi:hypothetical protein